MEHRIVRQELSPNGRFSLDVSWLGYLTPYFLATFRCVDGSAGFGEGGGGFGPYPAASPNELSNALDIRWDLPDNVCGIYLGTCCYGLFRFGASRRRARASFRGNNSDPFTDDEIAWFCAKTHIQFRSSKK